jgi:hypothetical protein
VSVVILDQLPGARGSIIEKFKGVEHMIFGKIRHGPFGDSEGLKVQFDPGFVLNCARQIMLSDSRLFFEIVLISKKQVEVLEFYIQLSE